MRIGSDVIIVGGGPAGSTLASCLAKRGRTSLVLERERFPRFHIGESLLPRSCEVFDKLGLRPKLEERFLRKYGARFLCSTSGRVSAFRFDEAFDPKFSYAFQVPRADFDHLLLEHAEELGATVREEWEVLEILFEGTQAVGVRARNLGSGSVEDLFASVIVDATGRDTLVASRLRRKARIQGLDKTAFFCHYTGTFRETGEDEGNIQIVVFEHGWFWFIPFRGDVTSVGCVVSSDYVRTKRADESLDDFFDRTVQCSSWATEFLSNATRRRPVGALADFSYRIDTLVGDGWLFVGDAGGFLDPLFSTGAHLAIKGAELAAEAIDNALVRGDVSKASFADYEKHVRAAVDLFLGVVQSFYRGDFRELLFEPNQRPTMRKLITSLLSGDVFHHERKPYWVSTLERQYPAEVPTFLD